MNGMRLSVILRTLARRQRESSLLLSNNELPRQTVEKGHSENTTVNPKTTHESTSTYCRN
jgi:hypothetical protein